jgi:hypothetical protein
MNPSLAPSVTFTLLIGAQMFPISSKSTLLAATKNLIPQNNHSISAKKMFFNELHLSVAKVSQLEPKGPTINILLSRGIIACSSPEDWKAIYGPLAATLSTAYQSGKISVSKLLTQHPNVCWIFSNKYPLLLKAMLQSQLFDEGISAHFLSDYSSFSRKVLDILIQYL